MEKETRNSAPATHSSSCDVIHLRWKTKVLADGDFIRYSRNGVNDGPSEGLRHSYDLPSFSGMMVISP